MTDKRSRDQGKKTNKMLSFTIENRNVNGDVMEVVKTDDIGYIPTLIQTVSLFLSQLRALQSQKKVKLNLHSPNCKITS